MSESKASSPHPVAPDAETGARVDPTAATAALTRAREADSQLWVVDEHGSRSARLRQERDTAVLEALGAGLSHEQLADELGVRIADVQRMAAAARSRAAAVPRQS